MAIFAMSMMVQSACALTIIRNFLGGTPPTNFLGSGSLQTTFNYACDIWENAILDDYTLTLNYRWAPVGGAQHELIIQGGNPNRETEGIIEVNNDDIAGHFTWFLDPEPWNNHGQTNIIEEFVDLGGGVINGSRRVEWSQTHNYCELLPTLLHEIGHSLGLSYGNLLFEQLSVNAVIDITSPRPFAGSVVPLNTNIYGVVSHIAQVVNSGRTLMHSQVGYGELNWPSDLDILTLAQLSQFTNVNFGISPVLKISHQTDVELSWLQVLGQWKLQQSTNLRDWVTLDSSATPNTNGWYSVLLQTTGRDFFRLIRTDTPSRSTNIFPFPASIKASSIRSTKESACRYNSIGHKSGALLPVYRARLERQQRQRAFSPEALADANRRVAEEKANCKL